MTIHLEDESTVPLESTTGQEGDRINGASGSSGAAHHGAGPKKRRHRIPKQEKDKGTQTEPDIPMLDESPLGEAQGRMKGGMTKGQSIGRSLLVTRGCCCHFQGLLYKLDDAVHIISISDEVCSCRALTRK